VAWPPDGYFPIELATARWSLSHTSFLTADLSSASVSMTFEGTLAPPIQRLGTAN